MDIESEIKKVIGIEIDGLSLLQERINESVKAAVETISNCQEKVVLTDLFRRRN